MSKKMLLRMLKERGLVCPHCDASLEKPSSVVRCYFCRDEGCDDAYSEGHYHRGANGNYYFERDDHCDLSQGNFDLADDSDSCAACHEQV